MSTKKVIKLLVFGILNFLARFVVGGVLFMGLKMNPAGWVFGLILTVVALLAAYLLLKYVMKPVTLQEALTIAIAWTIIALVLDAITAQPVVGVSAAYLLSQIPTWTRLLAIPLVAPFTVPRKN